MSKRTPTPQQLSCIAAAVDKAIRLIKIEACAGAGKTSTLEMMAVEQPVPSLYLAFNKKTAEEGAERFPEHVLCKTTHSVAYSVHGLKLNRAGKLSRPKGAYVNVAGTGSEVARYFDLRNVFAAGEVVLTAPYLGLLVKTTVARFEQSADMEISAKHLPKRELEEKFEKATFNMSEVRNTILTVARKLWDERTDMRSPVLASHDTYLKMFQLSKPKLAGMFKGDGMGLLEVLYVDEFQDTTPCVLDIVMNQKDDMKIVMVGDARQAIYGWRGAVNAMKMVDAPTRALTKSFRYGPAVAAIATTVLEGDMQIEGNEKIKSVVGAHGSCVDRSKPYTRLFRTNAALLEAAIATIAEGVAVSIEIDVKDFVKTLESAMALFANKMKDVKHDKILPFTNWDELLLEADHDRDLARISKAVADGKADGWIRILSCHVNSKTPHVTFTTAHKSKGREFSQVIVEGDFKSALNESGEFAGLVEEEQNLLYVACTRAIDVLEYNKTVLEYIRAEGITRRKFNEAINDALAPLKRDVREAMAA